MFFVLLTLLRQTMTTDVTYIEHNQNVTQKDPEEEYFTKTEEALRTIIQTFIYKNDAKSDGGVKRKKAKIKEYFALKFQLFGILVDYYKVKSEHSSDEESRSEKLIILGERVTELDIICYKKYFEAFEDPTEGVFRYENVGQRAITRYKEKVEQTLTKKEATDENPQNPFVIPSTACKNIRMRVILSLISTTFDYSLTHRNKVYEKYKIEKDCVLFKTLKVRNFLDENYDDIEKNESIYKLAIEVRKLIDYAFDNDPSNQFMPALLCLSACACLLSPIIYLVYGLGKLVRFFTK